MNSVRPSSSIMSLSPLSSLLTKRTARFESTATTLQLLFLQARRKTRTVPTTTTSTTFSSSSFSSSATQGSPPLRLVPPFTKETAILKVRAAEDAWNSQDPQRVKMAYTQDTIWRNRSQFLHGRDEVEAFLQGKWNQEQEYRLVKELWAFTDNRIAVRFCYEYRHNPLGTWFRAHGNENWEFDQHGLMKYRHASINDVSILETERKFHWPWKTSRPANHPGLSDLGL